MPSDRNRQERARGRGFTDAREMPACFGGKRKAKNDPQQRKKAVRAAAAAAYAPENPTDKQAYLTVLMNIPKLFDKTNADQAID